MPSSLTPWETPPETTQICDEEYAPLEVIDISAFSAFDGNISKSAEERATQDDIVSRARDAFSTLGFIAIKGHGLSEELLQHHLNLGKMFLDDVSEEEKHSLRARIHQDGSWAGYKPQGYHKRANGAYDYQEHYDFYPFTAVESKLPQVAKPYLRDFREFIEHNHFVILRKILGIISIGLNLPVDTFWKLHHSENADDDGALRGGLDEALQWRHSKDHLRYNVYNPPTTEGEREKRKYLWLPGHTDQGSVTFIYSQPIAGLQVYTPKGQWKYIRHYHNHIIVNLGDAMEFLTGGILKATPHRVAEPPEDQRHLRRLGIFYFVPFSPDTVLKPLDYPALRERGMKDLFEEYYALGGKPLTMNDWLVARSKMVGTGRSKPEHREPGNVLEDVYFRYS